MEPQRQIVIDLVRLGLRGEANSVRQYVLRLLRKAPTNSDRDRQFRETLTKLVLEPGTELRMTRTSPGRGSRQGVPVDAASFHPLARVDSERGATRPILDPKVAREVQQIIDERLQGEKLAQAGVDPTRSVLFTGAPGTGKTMTARYLADALGLPLVTIDLASVMSSFLGKTGQNLREALDFARNARCVVLLDEFDALGKRRDDPTDVGELKRIVNVLLLELENWPPQGLLIAATNHPELLDRAIWRRFDRVIDFGLPQEVERVAILEATFAEHNVALRTDALRLLARMGEGASGSSLVRLAKETIRDVAMGGESVPENIMCELLLSRLMGNAIADHAGRVRYAGVAHEVLRHPLRQIGQALGVSHVTAGKLVKEYRVSQPAKRHSRTGSTVRTPASPIGAKSRE